MNKTFDITLRVSQDISAAQVQRVLASWRMFKTDRETAELLLPPPIVLVFKALPADAEDDLVLNNAIADRLIGVAVRAYDDSGAAVARAKFDAVVPPKEPPADTKILVVTPERKAAH